MARLTDDLRAVLTQLGDVERRLVVLSFDGTLADIVDDGGAAQLSPGAAEGLAGVAARTTVAVVSGRRLDDLISRLPDVELALVGGHGAELRFADGRHETLTDLEQCRAVLDGAQEAVRRSTDEQGWRIERKAASLAVHYRRVSPAEVERRLPAVRETLAQLAADHQPWELLEGKAVLELRHRDATKGEALRRLHDRNPGRYPLVIGDDVSDEDAFQVARQTGGDGVLVARHPRKTAARWRLDDPQRVVELLEELSKTTTPHPSIELGEPEGRRFHPIGEYGIIGDSRTAALISPDASIDWLCSPRFDSPSLFAALLDPVRGGRFRVRPADNRDVHVQRTYLGETNVLVTRFVRDGNPVLTVTDFLVYSRVNSFDPDYTGHILLRRLEAFSDIEVEVEFQPRFDYGRVPTVLHRTDDGLRGEAGNDYVDLVAPWTGWELLDHEDGNGHVARTRFTQPAFSRRWLRLQTAGHERGPHRHLSEDDLLDLTVRTWGRWARQIDYDGPWREAVVRSALMLKALVYEPTGALIAAPTTSLPEDLGGERNWDYRYAWIRDSAYVLETFLKIGHTREAETFIRWLAALNQRIGGAGSLRPVYRVTGEDDLTEFELGHLTGYQDSRPVRVGNDAASQVQLDIYGAAMELGYLTEQLGGEVPAASWQTIAGLVDTVSNRWREPDSGLWEIRNAPRHHTFSKFQCWLSVDRAIRIGTGLGLYGPYERWQRVADTIREDILRNGYSVDVGAFTQAYGSPELDAAVLMLPLKGFMPAQDHRVRSTVQALRDQLEVADGLLLRYQSPDGLQGGEGAFLMCSFWLTEVLARMGELDEAIRLFERLLSLAGPLGLYGEEIDPATHQHLGNFPQGFTHMGLVGAATAIADEIEARGGHPKTAEVVHRSA